MKRYKTVDDYIAHAAQWQDELRRLREILQSTELTEDVKWGAPCYTFDKKNVVGILGFKSYFGFWFHQGVLLEDRKKVLIDAQRKNESTAAVANEFAERYQAGND